MKIVVPIQLVPDLVEELIVDDSGKMLDPMYVRWIVNEFDDHALEQAILLKEKAGAEVVVVAPDGEGIDDTLYNAAARGADRLVKIVGLPESGVNNHALARIFFPVVKAENPDLVLTGVQVHSSLDGTVGPLLAEYLQFPFVSYVSGVTPPKEGRVIARKDYPAGLVAEMDVRLPALLAIQAAETPPRYVPISKIRQVMKTCQIQEVDAGAIDPCGGISAEKLYQPETGERAVIFEGDLDAIASQITAILKEKGVL